MLRSRLDKVALELPARVNLAIKAGAELVERGAKDRVPVDSGRLHDAIHVEENDDGDGYLVIAGDDDVFYGHIVEHGGAHSPAQPFLTPAAEAAKGEIAASVTAALRGL